MCTVHYYEVLLEDWFKNVYPVVAMFHTPLVTELSSTGDWRNGTIYVFTGEVFSFS